MNAQNPNTLPNQHEAVAVTGLVDLLIVLAKHKKKIIGFPIATAAVALAVSFAIPNVYRATTKLLPPQQAQSGTAAALLSQLGGAAGAMAGAAGIKNPNDVYLGMLKSRRIADKLIEEYALAKVYDKDSAEKTRNELTDNTFISKEKDGFILIEVEDESPQRAAKLANSYVSELLSLTKVIAVTEASQRRVFFERQLEMAKDNLAKNEANLKKALDANGIISVDADSRAFVETVGRLRAHIAAKEIELNSMQAFVTTDNNSYKRVKEELLSLRAELSKLQNGRSTMGADENRTASTASGLSNVKILRDVKYYQMLYELLSKQYEMARLDEANDAPVIQVLDPAISPERKVKPKRSIIALASLVFGFVLAVLAAFVAEARKKIATDPVRLSKWEVLRGNLRFK
jgi:tyrosine-protein kinase Etk/Wzc